MNGTILTGTWSGAAWPKPGRKKLAGDTLCEALMPLQPAPSATNAGQSASQKCFPSSFKRAHYRYGPLDGNT